MFTTVPGTAAYCHCSLLAFQQVKKPFLEKTFSPPSLVKPRLEPIGSCRDDTECQPAAPVHPMPQNGITGQLQLGRARGKARGGKEKAPVIQASVRVEYSTAP